MGPLLDQMSHGPKVWRVYSRKKKKTHGESGEGELVTELEEREREDSGKGGVSHRGKEGGERV